MFLDFVMNNNYFKIFINPVNCSQKTVDTYMYHLFLSNIGSSLNGVNIRPPTHIFMSKQIYRSLVHNVIIQHCIICSFVGIQSYFDGLPVTSRVHRIVGRVQCIEGKQMFS